MTSSREMSRFSVGFTAEHAYGIPCRSRDAAFASDRWDQHSTSVVLDLELSLHTECCVWIALEVVITLVQCHDEIVRLIG